MFQNTKGEYKTITHNNDMESVVSLINSINKREMDADNPFPDTRRLSRYYIGINENQHINRHLIFVYDTFIEIDSHNYKLETGDFEKFENLYTQLDYKEKKAEATYGKPVIYLYPTAQQDVSVKLDYNGKLLNTYPLYNDGWNVTAFPDGRLVNKADNLEYSYLFWDGSMSFDSWDWSEGYVVAGKDTAAFLQKTLAEMGLTPKEYNEFIVYWMPKMKDSKYNLITFQTSAYESIAQLDINPKPDSMLRVFMVYKPLDKPISVKEPVIKPFVRNGFTVVEWGGRETD